MTQKKRVLLVGQNPDCFTGNGNMLGACLEDIDSEKYDVCLFINGTPSLTRMEDPFNYQSTFSCKYIQAEEKNDNWGRRKLLNLLYQVDIDIVVFVGIDIWRYIEIFQEIKKIQKEKDFVWKVLVPYDLDHIRKDWMLWFNYPDQVYVYSEFGYNMIKDHVPSAKYYRPKLRYSELYKPLLKDEKKDIRKQIFPDADDDTIIFGFVGANQIRKNIYNILGGFSLAVEKYSNIILYMHMDNVHQVFGINRISEDFKIPSFNLRHNANSRGLSPIEMSVLWGTFDCHLLPSLQEGLSWTVVESKLTGIPSILSITTAHHDFFEMSKNGNYGDIVFPVQTDHKELISLITREGLAYLQTNACSDHKIAKAIIDVIEKGITKNDKISEEAREFGKKWIEKCSNFQNDILDDESVNSFENENNTGEIL